MSTRPALSESGPSVCWERREPADCGLSQSADRERLPTRPEATRVSVYESRQ
jgi:hypothetical protein